MVVTHASAGLVLAPTGLVLEAPSYLAVWAVWLVGGVVAFTTREKRHAALALFAIDSMLCAVALFVLPALSPMA
jgi:hypothetical protein